jgi:hypothetical protein
MSTKQEVKPPIEAGTPSMPTLEAVRHYTAEEIVKLELLPCGVRWLKDGAYARRLPHTKVAGKIRFRLDHILAISQLFDVDPATRGRRRAARAQA